MVLRAGSSSVIAAVVLPVALGAMSACAVANGSVTGGEYKFDTALPVPDPTMALTCASVKKVPLSAGHTWGELYEDYFGPNGGASCAGDGQCHGAADLAGAKGSGGFVCTGGKDGCYGGMTSPKPGLVTAGKMVTDPAVNFLYSVLRKADGGGSMPKRPACIFEANDLKRIADWLAEGAPNN